MHQAFDLEQELVEVASLNKFPKPKEVLNRIILTTNTKEDAEDEHQKDNFNKLKESFLGPKDKGGKALVI